MNRRQFGKKPFEFDEKSTGFVRGQLNGMHGEQILAARAPIIDLLESTSDDGSGGRPSLPYRFEFIDVEFEQLEVMPFLFDLFDERRFHLFQFLTFRLDRMNAIGHRCLFLLVSHQNKAIVCQIGRAHV